MIVVHLSMLSFFCGGREEEGAGRREEEGGEGGSEGAGGSHIKTIPWEFYPYMGGYMGVCLRRISSKLGHGSIPKKGRVHARIWVRCRVRVRHLEKEIRRAGLIYF